MKVATLITGPWERLCGIVILLHTHTKEKIQWIGHV